MTRLRVAVSGLALSVIAQAALQHAKNLKLHAEMLKFFNRHIGVSRPMAAASTS